MTNYFKEYTSAENQILSNRLMVIKNHISHYPVLDEELGFQYYLNKKFTEYFESLQDKTVLKKHFPQLSVYILFFYNVQSLQTALYSLECNMIHQAAVNVRTVYESIPKMFYLALFPNQVGKIAVYELIHSLKYEEAVKELTNEECVTYLDGEELVFNDKSVFEEFKKEFSISAFRKKLYTIERQHLIKQLYGRFSLSTHPNITRNTTAVTYTKENTESFFEFLKSLSYFNVASFLEGSFEILRDIGLEMEIFNFLNELAPKLKTMYDSVNFFPDKDDVKGKLKVHPV